MLPLFFNGLLSYLVGMKRRTSRCFTCIRDNSYFRRFLKNRSVVPLDIFLVVVILALWSPAIWLPTLLSFSCCECSIVVIYFNGCPLCVLFPCCEGSIVVIYFNGFPCCFLSFSCDGHLLQWLPTLLSVFFLYVLFYCLEMYH